MLVRFKPVSTIFDEIDSILHSTAAPIPAFNAVQRSGRFGAVSMKENDEQVQVFAELPGVEKKNVTVHVHDGVLTISADRQKPELKENEQWIRNEIPFGKYERSLQLPYTVNAEKVTATHENGILSIILPKHENAKPKHITIR